LKFIDLIKRHGRHWNLIAEMMNGAKNEQQCRTRGIILLNKLKVNCFDQLLYEKLLGRNIGVRRPGRLPGERKGIKINKMNFAPP